MAVAAARARQAYPHQISNNSMSDASIPRADELLLIGTVVNVVGLRGMVRMSVASTEPEFFGTHPTHALQS
jgi:ribosomal 30S subunit maturation factor RimM